MNSLYCMSLGAFMMAAVARYKDDWSWFGIYMVSGIVGSYAGQFIK